MPRQVDHDARRREIVLGVWSLIARAGIESVTLRRVAAEAGVSVGRIQHYFAGRTELVRASARAMLEAAHDRYDGVTWDEAGDTGDPDHDVGDAAEALRFAVAHVIPGAEMQRVGTTVWYAYVAASVADPGLAAILTEGKRGQEDEVVRLLGLAHPGIDEAGRKTRARILIALADGLAVRVLVGDVSAEDAVATLEAEIQRLAGPGRRAAERGSCDGVSMSS